MFDYKSMLDRALKFFPTWSDIRKRPNKSIGGKLVSSITEETVNIEQAIQEYIDYYFLNKHQEKNTNIIAFAYRSNIGKIDSKNLKIKYNDIVYNIDMNIDKFINSKDVVYYENGYVYIKEDIYKDDNIYVIYKDNYLAYRLEKYHVWNIYDEFACFIGMERHENETNEELYNRMLFFNRNKPNGSELGLKNAIISELMIYEPNLTQDDIKIERVNENNLRKPYEDYNELLDKLNEMNRDVYRWKKWDLDEWIYEFKTIEYLPYKWNEVLKKWKNGIGFNDDLKVIVSNNTTHTDSNITLYEKSQERLLSYIHNNDIYKSIGFTLKSYKDVLNSIPVNYKINASPIKKINPEEFVMNIYEDTYVNEIVNIENIFSFGSNIKKKNNNVITDTYSYKLHFKPENGNDIEIKKCRVLYKKDNQVDHIEDLLSPANNFIINSLGHLVNTSTKKNIKNLSKLNSFYGLKNLDKEDGFTLANNMIQGSGSVTINGLGGNELNYNIKCEMSELPKQYIQYNSADCIWNNEDKQLILLNNNNNKIIEIDILANQLSFDILCNNSVLVYTYNEDTDNWNQEQVIGSNVTWKSEASKEFRNIRIKIESNSKDKITLGNFKYSKYEVLFETDKNKLTKKDNVYILPNLIENTLYFKIKSYSGYAPIIKNIYIGTNTENVSYMSDITKYKSGFSRILEIDSNCKVDLIKINPISDNTVDIIENYNSCTSYEGLSDDAFIRLNLSDYDSIENIYTKSGSIDMIEESGITYYNLKLSNKESASTVQIIGNKNIEKEKISLYDMILIYYPSFDISKDYVYCSRLADGLIISTNGENNNISILQLDSNLFAGLNILKYEFDEIPNDLNIIWGINNTDRKYSFSHSGEFEYISFCPADSKIHSALNTYNLFTDEVKNIKVINNFNPYLNTSDLNFYSIEIYDNNNDVDIRFYNDLLDSNTSFNKLKKWSVGLKNLYIKCDLDLLNSITYNVSESYILDEVKLNQSIKIKDSYNDNTIQTNKCVLEVSDDMEVIYEHYDGTSDTEDLLIKEVIEVQNDGFKKLEYANIDEVFYIGTNINGSLLNQDNLFTDYTILKDEGIIVWNNLQDHIGKVLYVTYTIKRANYIYLSDEFLYKTISYNINAYKEIAKYFLKNLKDGDTYDLNKLDKFKESDLVYISCSEPTFEGIMTEDNKIKFNKYSSENNILVKTGYYYINGKEYYLFSNDDTLELNTNNNMYSENIDIENGKIITYKATDNNVRNTSMIQKGINNLFNFDYTDTMVKGVSNFEKYTSCDSYNNWHANGMKISLTDEYKNKGCNDIALSFTNIKKWGYAFIDITDYLFEDKTSYLSFISFKLKTYIGKEKKVLDIDLPESFNIEIIEEIKSNTNLKSYSLNKNDNEKYYLIVKGEGILDDIVITDNVSEIYSSHNKNIDLLGFNLNDNKTEGDVFRLEILDNNYNSNCAGICSDGLIKTTSKLDWNITKIKEYRTREDWLGFELDNVIVENNYVQSINDNSSVTIGEPIFIENPYTINRLIVKANDINFEEMKDIKIYIYTSNERNGIYRLYTFFDSNYGFVYGNYLSRYIKIKLVIPKGKVVINLVIYSEYKSEEPNIVTAETSNVGYIISNIFDSQENLKYKIKDVNISDVKNLDDISIYIRAAKTDAEVWTDWKELDLTSKNDLILNNARYFQLKILLNSKHAQLKFNYIDLEVI